MPNISNELGPIRSQPVVGPAIDAWNARKEDDGGPVARSEDFRANLEALKADFSCLELMVNPGV